ncbi:YceI-like domain-containing protein [Gelidibacter sediminis]|uniref:YceI-like domain-containing protein n=1 Tax=Gelidibacter sediminis TaxID=1608710 RepID=A0A4R7PHU3_9FLAO|nr:YceI family protein [Gelidibacter sediminis]TDU33807.1 YceI-like domain-containing protein [Gelidibacter sediminis]
MKRLLYLLPLLVLVSFTGLETVNNSTSVRITPQSKLHIKGTSNVTDFTCQYNIKNLNKPIRIHYVSTADVIKFKKSELILENSGFDCGGKGINRDFHDLLKSNTYPEITLSLKQIKLKPDTKNIADATVQIEIAGQKHTYHMETKFHKDNGWHISGVLKLNIKDFQLEAPKKMLGLIVVSEEIEINFKLVVEEC